MATHGWSTVAVNSASGTLLVQNIQGNSIQLSTTSGSIWGNGITAAGQTVTLGHLSVETKNGDIHISNVDSGGYVHVQSHSGDIFVHLKGYTFRGLFYLRSERGSILVRPGKFSFDIVNAFNVSDITIFY